MEASEKNKQYLNDVLDWMETQFEGSILPVAIAAANRARADGLISGPLWEEIGSGVLHHLYKIKRIHRPRHDAVRLTVIKGREYRIKRENRAIMYYIDGRYYNLFDLTAKEVKEIAKHYDTLAKGNAYERDFLLSVADRLKGKQVVGEVFNEEGLRELRREITSN